ncbi:MAG: hypothetical protein QOD26_2778 [Betaproteobacteria bacterium]|nr:hypothetical protein [Betaproteobacteria bacterium]
MRYDGVHCRLSIERPAAGVVVLQLTGWDVGEFGDAPMKALEQDVARGGIRFFIDARAVKAATIDVSNDWALWLRQHKARFISIHMLTGAPFVQLTAKFVQRFAELGDLMRIYTDAAVFDRELAAVTGRA